jgi:hypothetical protein
MQRPVQPCLGRPKPDSEDRGNIGDLEIGSEAQAENGTVVSRKPRKRGQNGQSLVSGWSRIGFVACRFIAEMQFATITASACLI